MLDIILGIIGIALILIVVFFTFSLIGYIICAIQFLRDEQKNRKINDEYRQ